MKSYYKGGFFFVSVLAFVLIAKYANLDSFLEEAWIDSNLRDQGASGVLLFLVVTCLFSGIGVPRQIFGTVAGYAFGAVYGFLWVSCGVTLGCAFSFAYARFFGRSTLRKKFGNSIGKLNAFLKHKPFLMTIAVRLFPIGSNMATNFGAGLTDIPAIPFILGSCIGYLPQNLIFSILGSGIRFDPTLKILISIVLFIISSSFGIYIYNKYKAESLNYDLDPLKKKTKNQIDNLGTRVLLVALSIFVTSGILSVLQTLEPMAKDFNIDLETAYFSFFIFGISGLISTIITSFTADRVARKIVLSSGLFLFIIGGLVSFFSNSFFVLLLGRALQGAGSAPIGILYATIVADTWQGSKRTKMMSICGIGVGIGSALNPLLGSLLVQYAGWHYAYLLVLLVIPFALLALSLPLAVPTKKVSFKQYLKNIKSSLNNNVTIVLLVLAVLFAIVQYGTVITCFPIIASSKFLGSPLAVGLLFFLSSISAGFMASRVNVLSTFIDMRSLFISGLLFYLGAIFLAPFMTSVYWLAVPFLLFGLGQGITMPLLATLLAGQVDTSQRAGIFSVNSCCLRLVQAGVPSFFSYICIKFSANTAILLSSFTVFAGLILIFYYIPTKLFVLMSEDIQKNN